MLRATSAVSALTLLATGCLFGARRGAPPPVPRESQAEMSARFPASPTTYRHCVDVGVSGDLEDEFIPVTYAITPEAITSHDGDREPTVFGLGRHYDMGDEVYVAGSDSDGFNTLYLVGDFLYSARERRIGSDLSIGYICSRTDDAGAIRAMDGKAHLAYLKAYRDLRSAVASEDYSARMKEARARQEAKAAAAAGQPDFTAEQRAQIERARTMVALAIEASARNASAPITLWVTLALADGTTMRVGIGNPIFDEVLGYSKISGEVGMLLAVWSKDDPTLRVEEEVYFSLDTAQALVCRGRTGLSGVDPDASGAMSYVGQPGERGPDVTVEITTTGRTNPEGEQILRYRLRCGDEERVFDASATSPVEVASHGGKGGHGIPRQNYDGTSGGAGGDGGDITIIADPSVLRYNVSASSHGGPGGNASSHARTAIHRMGRRGPAGADGDVVERRAPVTLP